MKYQKQWLYVSEKIYVAFSLNFEIKILKSNLNINYSFVTSIFMEVYIMDLFKFSRFWKKQIDWDRFLQKNNGIFFNFF